MSIISDRVKKWRNDFKDRIIKAFGGACLVCGYKKCQAALVLHHLDPQKKNFGLASIRANPTNWDKVVSEIRKCILLCHNCHYEYHSGLIDLPTDVILNEDVLNYKQVSKLQNYDECKCGNRKLLTNKYCGIECAGINRSKVDWSSIDLCELLKTKNVLDISFELGVSNAAIYKRLRKLGIKSPSKKIILHQ